MLGRSMSMARKDFGISCFQTLLFLFEVILPGISAYGLATVLFSDMAKCGDRFYDDIVPAGVSSGLTRLFFSEAFIIILARAILAQIHTNLLVIPFATLCRVGLYRARARAILAGLYKPTVPATFLKAVAVLGTAFWLLDHQRELETSLMARLMVLGDIALYLVWTVGMAVSCRLVLEDPSTSGFGSMRRRLELVVIFWPVAAILALLGGIILPVAALTATAFPSQLLVAGTAFAAVRCTMMVVMLVAQPEVYLILWDGYHSFC